MIRSCDTCSGTGLILTTLEGTLNAHYCPCKSVNLEDRRNLRQIIWDAQIPAHPASKEFWKLGKTGVQDLDDKIQEHVLLNYAREYRRPRVGLVIDDKPMNYSETSQELPLPSPFPSTLRIVALAFARAGLPVQYLTGQQFWSVIQNQGPFPQAIEPFAALFIETALLGPQYKIPPWAMDILKRIILERDSERELGIYVSDFRIDEFIVGRLQLPLSVVDLHPLNLEPLPTEMCIPRPKKKKGPRRREP